MSLYRTIVADPPWEYRTSLPPFAGEGEDRSETPYPTMTTEEIAALPVRDLSYNLDEDAHLYLWTTNTHLEQAFGVAREWGFHHSITLVWCKEPRGAAGFPAYAIATEFVLFCRRPKVVSRPDVLQVTSRMADAAEAAGLTRRDVDRHMGTSDMAGWWLSRLEHRCLCPTPDQWERLKRFLSLDGEMDDDVARLNAAKGKRAEATPRRPPVNWFSFPRGAHSAKPEAFLDMVETVSAGPYLEMFARRQRLGWDTWGNEALEHIAMGAA